MEVHHHSHTPRKKFRHYFWEFFMLFLAVTAGFLVENQREHFIEHRREKQYILSLINDLATDTARLNALIELRSIRTRRLDSMGMILNSDTGKKNTSYLYYVAVSAARTLPHRFLPNDGTMQQLKNAGALRLIRNHYVRDAIARYDVAVRNYLRQGEVEETVIDSYRGAAWKIFNARLYDQMLDSDLNVVRRLPDNPPLLSYTANDLNEFNYRLFGMKGLNTANGRDGRSLLELSQKLITLLKNAYHLD